MVSHPTWVRGLKQQQQLNKLIMGNVAPYVGAWIETFESFTKTGLIIVAPYVGAWIET